MRKPSPSILIALLTLTTAVSAAACGNAITGGGANGNAGGDGGGSDGPSDNCPSFSVPNYGDPCLTEGAKCAYADTSCSESAECHSGKWISSMMCFPPSPPTELKGPAISFLASQRAGVGVDVDTLTVRIGDIEPTCMDLAANPPCGAHWFVSFELLPWMLQPGTYDLKNYEGGVDYAAACPKNELGASAGGRGKITVQHSDDQGIDFTLAVTFADTSYVRDTFHAPRCP